MEVRTVEHHTLDESQRRAVETIVSSRRRVNLLIGRAGYGKTFTTQHIVQAAVDLGVSKDGIFFAASTGKAAKILQEELAWLNMPNEAMTIHRMLGCRGSDWVHGRLNPMKAGLIFIDESSMIDTPLFARILYSTIPSAKLVFVGDPAQLFPVGPGCPFADIVTANPPGQVSELKVCHRQKDGSLIANACESARNGRKIIYGSPREHTLAGALEDDLFLHEHEDNRTIKDDVADTVRPWFRSDRDWVCLSPQHSGAVGIIAMNHFLKDALNGDQKQHIVVARATGKKKNGEKKDKIFRLGDRVRQTKNNYRLKVYNGYIGTVVDIHSSMMAVDYGDETVVYEEKKDMFDLELGYCVSIHSSQGSGYRYGVIIADRSHTFMWTRQLIYVALSRFKQKCHVIGQRRTVARAIRKNMHGKRMTYLSEVL